MSIFSSFLQIPALANLTRDSLLALDAETAHQATIKALEMGVHPQAENPASKLLSTNLAGIELPNPVGMAAGFDKNAQTMGALSSIGFGFCEVGTVTPRPQEGNAKPRLFRVGEGKERLKHMAVVNRMGFNNDGHAAVFNRMMAFRKNQPLAPVGVNIGANKDSDDFVNDYILGVERFSELATYLTANISSPNTPGLRGLQHRESLHRLLNSLGEAQAKQKSEKPIFLKIAPDLDEGQMDDIAEEVLASSLAGIIVSNTTLERENVRGLNHAGEQGGLSGKPLFELSTIRLAQMRLRLGNDMPIIGVGGVHSAKSALAKIEAGANAIQIYSALVFGGFELLQSILAGLESAVRRADAQNLSELVGTKVNDWTERKA